MCFKKVAFILTSPEISVNITYLDFIFVFEEFMKKIGRLEAF